MKTYTYKVVGISKPKSFTLYEGDDHCWAKSGLLEIEFDELFRRAKNEDGFWKKDIQAAVQCNDLGLHGSPIDGVVTAVSIDGVPFIYRSPN